MMVGRVLGDAVAGGVEQSSLALVSEYGEGIEGDEGGAEGDEADGEEAEEAVVAVAMAGGDYLASGAKENRCWR